MRKDEAHERWQRDARTWYKLTGKVTLAAIATAAFAAYALPGFPFLFVMTIFLGGVASLLCFGHAVLFSLLYFRHQIRMLVNGIAATPLGWLKL